MGQRRFGFEGKILGISIDESEDWLKKTVSRLASEASARFGGRNDFEEEDVLANADYCMAGYGIVTQAEREAVGLFAKTEGLLLDPVYTGRAAAGMVDLIRRGYFKRGETVLFWHTGGQPALFADRYADLMGEAGATRA